MRATRAGPVVAVIGALLGASLAAQRPALSIELAHDSPNEQRAKEQLERLLSEHDLSRWVFTKRIRIEQSVQPHSHPVLTLNTRSLADDRQALASFVHEQIHWFLAGRSRDTNKAIASVRTLYPDAPDRPAAGGARDRNSTHLHLIVCQLEFESLRALLGADAATAVLQNEIAFGKSGPGYYWIYQTVLDDQARLSALVRKHALTLPGLP